MTTKTPQSLYSLSEQIGRVLQQHQHKLVTAESCTGGWIAKCITDVAGSSQWFDRAWITYSNQAKLEMLGLTESLLNQHGAVSRQIVETMVAGAMRNSCADIGVAVSGIAGPGGGTEQKPVGTVWFAWQQKGQACVSEEYRFRGNREQVRQSAVKVALTGILSIYEV